MIRIGLMGFGHIGRNIFRILRAHPQVEVGAISDIADPKALLYLLKYSTVSGLYPDDIQLEGDALFTRGRKIAMVQGKNPGDVDWSAHNVDIVIEATGRPHPKATLMKHIEAGAKQVVLCVPPSDAPDRTIVMGTNDDSLSIDDKVISNASVTAHGAAPLLTTLNKAFGIERTFFTCTHGYTNEQRLADVPANDLRSSRAASENIIPAETGTPDVLQSLFPWLDGKVAGLALSVPVPNGAMLDTTCFLKTDTTVDEVNAAIQTGYSSLYPNIASYTDDPIVSSDIRKNPYSTTFDSLATSMVGTRIVKTVSWFDQTWGYAHRAIELVQRIAALHGESV